ncbi:uncharacterized protein N7496_003571 [Penicillium cataractarum]|uniref:Uncharacterized protein n=1 Tax=Penicillium cataractarum TaxID=2100454 RepID=A0A9W9VGB7_9EURO|nr:uncharacterized protein N7496_003571 [Penicillium cataractarum]KAJ5381143.1 hypothetical protein N7496_003571 [Penicillium cataractarum]
MTYRQIPESLESKFFASCKACQRYYKFEVRRFSGEYMIFISTRYLDVGQAVARNCPGDGRSKKILSEEELILRNVKLVTEHKYEAELTLMMAESGIWFERPEIS